MVMYGPIWSHIVLYALLWLCIVPCGRIWSLILWSCKVFEILSSPIALLSPVRCQTLVDIESLAFLLITPTHPNTFAKFGNVPHLSCLNISSGRSGLEISEDINFKLFFFVYSLHYPLKIPTVLVYI